MGFVLDDSLQDVLPCPFCGRDPALQKDIRYPRPECNPVDAYEVICNTLKCVIYKADNQYYRTPEEAIQAWNTRTRAVGGGWIKVTDRLPEQHRSIFAPWYGRKEWATAMWREESDRMIVAISFSDGTGTVCTGRLHDGKWHTDVSPSLNPIVTHWMPLPKLPKEG